MGTAGDRGPVHGGGLVSRSYPCICVSAEDFVQQATRKCHEAAAAAADSSLRCSLLPPPSMHLEDELCQCHRAVLSPRAWLASDHRCRHLSNDDNCFASCSQWNEYCSVSKDCLLNVNNCKDGTGVLQAYSLIISVIYHIYCLLGNFTLKIKMTMASGIHLACV